MKISILASAVLALSVFSAAGNADTPIASTDVLQGTWKLAYTKNSATAKESIPREDTWVFKNDTVAILNIPREGGHYNQAPVKLELENGKLKVPYVGRSGFDIFTLLEKTDNAMTLKGKFGEHYFFEKK